MNTRESESIIVTILFYSVRESPYGCFSNFAPYPFELDGKRWPTSEHYFQAQKFAGTPHEKEVRQARGPMRAAEMGRERNRPLRPDWERVKDDVMRRAVLRKFEMHDDIRALLLATGDQEIVENAPRDYYWGCGADGSGKNMLGKILMEVREKLRHGVDKPHTGGMEQWSPPGEAIMTPEEYDRLCRSDCFVCRIVAGNPLVPTPHIVYEDDSILAFLNQFPTQEGYTLVCPKCHVERYESDLSPDEWLHLQAIVLRVSKAVSSATGAIRMYIASLGSPERNAHLHIHVCPCPSGTPFARQQFAAMEIEGGKYLNLPDERMRDIAALIREQLQTMSSC